MIWVTKLKQADLSLWKTKLRRDLLKELRRALAIKKISLLLGFLFYSSSKAREATDIAYRKAFRNSHPSKSYYRLISDIFYNQFPCYYCLIWFIFTFILKKIEIAFYKSHIYGLFTLVKNTFPNKYNRTNTNNESSH